MVIESIKGRFKVESNYRDAFRLDAFELNYIEECFDKYLYIVGDISSGLLRLKGFDDNHKSKNYYGLIDDYLQFSCAMGCPYYILKRLTSDDEYQKELANPSDVKTDGFVIHPLKKESFDKEGIVLETTPAVRPNISIDPQRINNIPKGELTQDLKEFVKQDKPQPTDKKVVEKTAPSQSYVSSSPGFVPNQNRNNFKKNNKKKNKK